MGMTGKKEEEEEGREEGRGLERGREKRTSGGRGRGRKGHLRESRLCVDFFSKDIINQVLSLM